MKVHIALVLAFVALASVQAEEDPRGPICDTCIAVITYIDDALANNEEDIITNLMYACPGIMPEYPEECLYMVATYGDEFIEFFIVKGQSPEEVCHDLHLCVLP